VALVLTLGPKMGPTMSTGKLKRALAMLRVPASSEERADTSCAFSQPGRYYLSVVVCKGEVGK
jgi:hypothetical protein